MIIQGYKDVKLH